MSPKGVYARKTKAVADKVVEPVTPKPLIGMSREKDGWVVTTYELGEDNKVTVISESPADIKINSYDVLKRLMIQMFWRGNE